MKMTRNDTTEKPIFILGAQRSGTTLVRLLLNNHPRIAIPDESTFLMPILKSKYLKQAISGERLKNFIRYLQVNKEFEIWNFDNSKTIDALLNKKSYSLHGLISVIFKSFCEAKGKPRWGDKTPSFFRKADILSKLFPQAKYLHIVRDGRDVFASYKKMKVMRNYAAVNALEWRYKVWKIENFLSGINPSDKITIRYEDLVANPEDVMKQVFNTIEEEYDDGILEFHKDSKYNVGKNHSNLIYQPISSSNTNKWKKELSKREINIFTTMSSGVLKSFDYEIGQKRLPFIDMISLAYSLPIGLIDRMFRIFTIKMIRENAMKKGMIAHVPVGYMPEVDDSKK